MQLYLAFDSKIRSAPSVTNPLNVISNKLRDKMDFDDLENYKCFGSLMGIDYES